MLYQQPQGGQLQVDPSLGADFGWTVLSGVCTGPVVSSSTAVRKATTAGVAISNGYSVLSGKIASMHSTVWTECGVVLLDGSSIVIPLSARATGQSVVFSPAIPNIDFVAWNVTDVNIAGGPLPIGIAHYVARRTAAGVHSVWLNGKLYGSATDTSVPLAYSSSILPAIGAAAGSDVYAGTRTLSSTTGLLSVVRTPRALSDAQCLALSTNHWQAFTDQDEDDEAAFFAVAAGGTDTPINPINTALAIAGYAPVIVQTANQSIAPGAGAMSIAGYAPALAQTANQNILPGTASMSVSGYAPSVAQSANQLLSPGAASLVVAGNAPTVVQVDNHVIAPGAGAMTLAGFAPGVAQSANQSITPDAGTMAITGYAPVLAQSDNRIINPGTGVIGITGYAPAITQVVASPILAPGTVAMGVAGYAPTVAQAPAFGAPRYARPSTDVTTGSWLPSVPGATLASMIDEPSADSSDYIYTTSAGTCEIALSPVQNPHATSGQVFRYQAWSPLGNAATVRLMCGATVIAEWVHASLPTAPTIFAQTLSAGQCSSITNYNDLRFVSVAG